MGGANDAAPARPAGVGRSGGAAWCAVVAVVVVARQSNALSQHRVNDSSPPRPASGFYYQRLAARVAAASVLAMAAVAWLGRDLLPAFAAPRAALLLVAAAEAVAGGDLAIDVPAMSGRGEVVRLSHGVRAMVERLRGLAAALRGAAVETSSMAAEITGGTDAMATAAQEMASTSSQLSAQAGEMATTLQALSGDASRLVGIAGELNAGAAETLARNGQVRALARENGERLDASA